MDLRLELQLSTFPQIPDEMEVLLSGMNVFEVVSKRTTKVDGESKIYVKIQFHGIDKTLKDRITQKGKEMKISDGKPKS